MIKFSRKKTAQGTNICVTYAELRRRQKLLLNEKINMSLLRIIEWYEAWQGNVYIAFSGGIDSTVLLHLVRSLYPEVPAVFCNTGLEYPEILQFVHKIGNVVWLRPPVPFHQIVVKYGYPVGSKKIARAVEVLRYPERHKASLVTLYRDGYGVKGGYYPKWKLPEKWMKLIEAPFDVSDRCCMFLKKQPFLAYAKRTERVPFIGLMASDSYRRQFNYVRVGCNAFESAHKQSLPMAFWLKNDVWSYIRRYKLSYAEIYDKGEHSTGCVFCLFGAHLDPSPNRFQRLHKIHPKLWNYCIHKLGLNKVMDYIGLPYDGSLYEVPMGGTRIIGEGLRSYCSLYKVAKLRRFWNFDGSVSVGDDAET